MFVFLFFVKNVNFDQFWKNHKFQKFANFRIKVVPIIDSFGLILKKTFPSMILKRKIKFALFFTYKRSKLFKNPKFSGKFRKLPMSITLEPNMLETWHFCQILQFWILYHIPPITQFRPKMDLGPSENELFVYIIIYCLKLPRNKCCKPRQAWKPIMR